jgi:hypothetical protein
MTKSDVVVQTSYSISDSRGVQIAPGEIATVEIDDAMQHRIDAGDVVVIPRADTIDEDSASSDQRTPRASTARSSSKEN